MSDIIKNISLYDQLGYVVVGSFFYIFLGFDLEYLGLNFENMIESTLVIAIAVYFLGHVAQTASSKIFTPKSEFTAIQKMILNEVKTHFSITTYTDQDAFQVCYLWACGVDKTGHISEMNAKFGLYRGWGFVLMLQSIFHLYAIIEGCINNIFNQTFMIGLLFTLPLAILMVRRARKFYFILGSKTIQTFVVSKHPL
jgi:hypothetical protein